MTIGIYKITNPQNKVYIGQSWDIDNRKKTYVYVDKVKSQTHIFNSLKKYGWKSHKFEIIHELPYDVSQDILDEYEIFYWQQYKDCGFEMLNVREPGRGGKHSEESKQKMSALRKGKTPWNKGKIMSEEVRQKMRKPKNKISESLKGKKRLPMSEECKKKIGNANRGKIKKPMTEETKKKLSALIKGKQRGPQSEETKQKIRLAIINKNKK